MDRLRITECLADLSARRGGLTLTRTELGEIVFGADPGRSMPGRSGELSAGRKRTLIGQWDAGKSLTALKPRHVIRLAEALRITRIDDLFESARP